MVIMKTINSCSLRQIRFGLVLILCNRLWFSTSFLIPTSQTNNPRFREAVSWTPSTINFPASSSVASSSSSSALHVWWFGGTDSSEETAASMDRCELVAVRIERTSANSRRIFGEITVPAKMDDLWSILTDYDRLSVHVPNLVESRVIQRGRNGRPGDGQYQCRLFQKGAQKIVGFEFGASVTMDMQEKEVVSPPSQQSSDDRSNMTPSKERKILFKCYDSFFFQEFDGEWKVQEKLNERGEPECLLSYTVDVRPKGPVPVAALEWRIREDVPTNLRSLKKAALEIGQRWNTVSEAFARHTKGKIRWYQDETMAAYLPDP